jgi:hypothetical protein
MMNRFEPKFSSGREAQLRYGGGDYQIAAPGDFVRCAVTGKPIPLDQLKYWDVDLQEAYSTASLALNRYLEKIDG